MIFRVFTLAFFCAIIFSCSPEQQLARKIGVKKKRMERAIVFSGKDGEEEIRNLAGQYRVHNRRITALSRDSVLFRRLQKLKLGRFAGPFFNHDSLGVHYYRVVSRKSVAYPVASVAQIHRSFGVGTKTFNKKIAEIITTCQENKLLLSSVLEDYEKDVYIGVGMVMPIKGNPISTYFPVIHDFFLNAPVFAVHTSEPREFPGTTITELMQKTVPTVYHDHIEFARIDMQRARPLKKIK
jgi:hypothetical protein